MDSGYWAMKKGLIVILCYVLMLYNCANVVTPEGGKKDEIPPEATEISPPNKSIHFAGSKIDIKFNEFIKLNDPFNQIVISPPLEKQPDIKVKGKSLVINFNAPLQDSTTYTINFGTSIQDITEGNIIQNFTYVFSTGSYIDSLSISGTVKDLLTGIPSDKALAVLYINPKDSDFLKQKPYYFSKVDKNGNYTINNIKPGFYRLYAIEDQNFNYYYDLPNEKIGFRELPLQIDSITNSQNISLFTEDKSRQQILESKSSRYGQSKIAFAKSIGNAEIVYIGENPDQGFFEKNSTEDTLTFWNRNIYLESHSFQVKYDSIDTVITIAVKPYPIDSNFKKHTNTFSSNIASGKTGRGGNDKERTTWDLKKKMILQFANPIDTIAQTQVFVTEDTLKTHLGVLVYKDSTDSRKLLISYNWKEATNYTIKIDQKSVKDIFGLYNDTATYNIVTKKSADYAVMNLHIINETGKLIIIQFLKMDFSKLNEFYLTSDSVEKNISIPLISPGKYKLRAIVDENNDRKWTTGEIMKNNMPEDVIFYSGEIILRANWENDIKWSISH